MKKIAIKLGNFVAILAMFCPFVVLCQYKELKLLDFCFLLVVSILYDVYMYSIIQQDKYINETKKLFENVFNGKILNSKTEEEKLNWYKVICINMFFDYFNQEKK